MSLISRIRRLIPSYALFPLIFALLWNQAVYCGARIIAAGFPHYDFTTHFDRLIPVVPFFTSIYFLAFPFWAIGYILCVRIGRDQAMTLLCGDFLAKGVCLIFFLLLPTTNIRPEIAGRGIWETLLLWLYRTDSPDNLFPSIHCLVSWLCFAGMRRPPPIPVLWQAAALFMALLVFLSTLFTRQHVIADVLGAVVIGEACYRIASIPRVRDCYGRMVSAFVFRQNTNLRRNRNRSDSSARSPH